jgi:hypothetical protein
LELREGKGQPSERYCFGEPGLHGHRRAEGGRKSEQNSRIMHLQIQKKMKKKKKQTTSKIPAGG